MKIHGLVFPLHAVIIWPCQTRRSCVPNISLALAEQTLHMECYRMFEGTGGAQENVGGTSFALEEIK